MCAYAPGRVAGYPRPHDVHADVRDILDSRWQPPPPVTAVKNLAIAVKPRQSIPVHNAD